VIPNEKGMCRSWASGSSGFAAQTEPQLVDNKEETIPKTRQSPSAKDAKLPKLHIYLTFALARRGSEKPLLPC
jgi:hypothetical protein